VYKFIDSNVIQQLIAGSETAFDVTYQAYSARVYRLAFGFLKDKEQSEEVVQECFISLWTSREKLNPEGNMWLYVYVIGKRLSLNALRQVTQSRGLSEKLINYFTEIDNHTEEDVLAHDLEQFTEKIISKLPKQQQLIFKLSRVEGLTHKEIAAQLQISPNTVKNHMVDALKTLRAQLHYADLICFLAVFYWV